MIVVSDSTPLITLMKAARIDLLHDLFGEIVIPEAVYRELIFVRAPVFCQGNSIYFVEAFGVLA